MATTITERHALDHGPGEVFERLCLREVIERRANVDPGLRSEVLAHEVAGDVVRIRTNAQVPLDWLPSAATSRGGTGPAIERLEVWTRSGDEVTGTTTYEISGVSAHAEGTMRVAPSGTGSILEEQLTLGVRVPLIGRLVEQALSRRIVVAMRREADLLDG